MGIGLWPEVLARHDAHRTFESFVRGEPLREMMAQARRAGPIKGFPLRADFTTARTYGERVLLVGESAGLVNPPTGEGIDCALESGRIAAKHLLTAFERGDFSAQGFADYDKRLRERFQSLFVFCEWLRRLFVNRLMLDRMVKAAARHPDLTAQLVAIVLQSQNVSKGIAAATIFKALAALSREGG